MEGVLLLPLPVILARMKSCGIFLLSRFLTRR